MIKITRTEAIEQIQAVLKAYENKIRDIRFNTENLSLEGKNIVDSYCSNEENEQVLVQKAYSDKKFFQEMTDKEIIQYHKICRELNQYLELGINNLEVVSKIEDNKIIISSATLEEVKYFLTKYKDLSNWEYDGHGCFVAKKNATLWELGGIYWDKLFELPENPDLIQIGDKIHLKQEVIDKIYKYAQENIDGEFSFEAEGPEATDIIYSLLTLGIGNKFGKGFDAATKIYDVISTFKDLAETTDVNLKLSYFIQQYGTEGLEEDGMKKFVSVVTFLGGFLSPIFSLLGLLSTTTVDENKYQIVSYNQRKAFLNSAKIEIKRIEELKQNISGLELKDELNYLRFLECQIVMINSEVYLNKQRDDDELNEILYNYAYYPTRNAVYKDTRPEYSPEYYHKIDYRKLFEANR